MAPPRSERGRAAIRTAPRRLVPAVCAWLVAAALTGAPLAAQGAVEPVSFRAPDGSRFVLLADDSIPQVHWALASPADAAYEPPGFEGLAWTVAQASLHGTWQSGSLDAARERDALGRLDEAWQRLLRNARDVTAAADVRQFDEEARELADLTVFPRLLAAAPTHRPELVARGPVAVLVLTTLPGAVGEVGRLLVERREDQPLRELPRTWLGTFAQRTQRHVAEPGRLVRAELLALAIGDHPGNRELEPPSSAAPTREQALGVWAATQHPTRTVHVLLGNFDAAAVRRTLEATFAGTSLPAPSRIAHAAPRPLAGTRRSTVHGVTPPSVALAWVLPPVADRFVLATATRWLGDGAGSFLGQELLRQGRGGATVRCTAPWPPASDGRGLLLVEASDPAGADGLADAVLAACQRAIAAPPEPTALQAVVTAAQSEWRLTHADPRWLAVDAAAAALLWPDHDATTDWPATVAPAAVHQLLQQALRAPHVVVEGRP